MNDEEELVFGPKDERYEVNPELAQRFFELGGRVLTLDPEAVALLVQGMTLVELEALPADQ